MARCDGPNCGAEIVWAETLDGRRQPFDREPDPRGNRVLLGRGPDRPPLAIPASIVVEGDANLAGCFYVPHHATCVDRDRFKGRRRG